MAPACYRICHHFLRLYKLLLVIGGVVVDHLHRLLVVLVLTYVWVRLHILLLLVHLKDLVTPYLAYYSRVRRRPVVSQATLELVCCSISLWQVTVRV
jgi:hypothetical protein